MSPAQRGPAAVARAVLPALACGSLLAQQGVRATSNPLPAVPWQPGPQRYGVTVPGSPGPTLSLYPANGSVGVATGHSLQEALRDPRDGGRNWYLVELYDHMCPHCWYAVPIVTDVAAAFKGHPTWRMESVNCHMRANAEVCFFLEIISGAMDYPTFLLCPPHGSRPAISEEENIRSLPKRAKGLLHQLGGSRRAAFMELLRCRIRFVEPNVAEGREDPYLSTQAVAQWVTHKTGLQVMHSEKLTRGADFVDKVQPHVAAPPGRPGWLGDDKEGAPGVPAWVPGQRWFDALRGFTALLHQGYREERHVPAVASAEFLARAFPVKGRALKELADRLRQAGPMSDPDVFRKLLGKWARSSGIPDPTEDKTEANYMTCTGSSCVMWTLLHVTLTAVAARGLSGRTLLGDESLSAGDGDENGLIGIGEAMAFVKTFVGAFLSCRRCKTLFLADFDNCAYGRCRIEGSGDFRGLALWLWRVHNAISLRVAMRQRATVDRRWPMYEDCPTCWRQALVMRGEEPDRRLFTSWSVEELDAPFRVDHVFWHMVRTYVGVQRVAFELSDLSRGEREEVRAVLERERAIAAGLPLPRPGDGDEESSDRSHHEVAQPASPKPARPAWQWLLMKLLIALGAASAGLAGILCYFGCDYTQIVHAMAELESRPTRSPCIRPPARDQQDGGSAAREEEDDLVEDGKSYKAGTRTHEEDPAAE